MEILKEKPAVFFFSGSGHSESAAAIIANRYQTPLLPIGRNTPSDISGALTVVVFPVYCQNLPPPVKDFLPTLSAKHLVILATYGGISPGNVLSDAQKLFSGTVIAGICLPTGHSFLREPATINQKVFAPLFERMENPRPAFLPQKPKNPFADFRPAWRSRMGVAIHRTNACTGCNLCGRSCPVAAIKNGKISTHPNPCIRCLHCVSICPRGALSFRVRPVLHFYLKKYQKKDPPPEIYL